MKIDFQRAGPADMGRLYPLEKAAFPTQAWAPDTFEKALADPGYEFEMALSEGRLLGYSLLNHDNHSVDSLAVDAAARGQKLGEQLLLRCLEKSEAAHYDAVTLEVENGNTPAEKLYAKYGFVPTKILSDYYGPGKDGTEMELKPLDPQFLQERREALGGYPAVRTLVTP